MLPDVTSTVPVTYTTQRTLINVSPGEEVGENKYTEVTFDTIVYDKNGQVDPVVRVNKVDYYA